MTNGRAPAVVAADAVVETGSEQGEAAFRAAVPEAEPAPAEALEERERLRGGMKERVAAQAAGRGLEAYAAGTVTTASDLRVRVVAGRRQGYVWTHGDFDDAINGVAAPVLDTSGQAIGAINLFGPSFRFPGSADEASIGERVAATAQAVRARLR